MTNTITSVASETPISNNSNGSAAQPQPVQYDEYGRDSAERTVELSPRDAEAVNVEVERGKHGTYDDALAYVIERGMAEIKRQRDAQQAAKAKTVLKTQRDLYASMLEVNPALVNDPQFVAKMVAALGLK